MPSEPTIAAPDRALSLALAERDRLRAQAAAQAIDMDALLEDALGGWWTWSVATGEGDFSAGFRARLGLTDAPIDAQNRAIIRGIVDAWLATDDRQPLDTAAWLTAADGQPVQFRLRAQVIERTDVGRPVKIIGGNLDLAQAFHAEEAATARLAEQTAELAALNDALSKQAQQLQRSNAALEDFAYAASHDLQTPLRAIAHFATWIDEDLPPDTGAEVREHVARLLDRVERLGQLHRDLLAYARVNHTQLDWVVQDLTHLVRAAWRQRGNPDFALIVQGELPEVRLPQAQMRAIIEEVVNNAVRHHDRDAGAVHVRLRQADGMVHIEIEDDGPGIEPRFAEQAFKVLETLRPRDAGAGSGMGLPIARQHARRAGGDLTLVRRDGRGAVFVVRCPVRAS